MTTYVTGRDYLPRADARPCQHRLGPIQARHLELKAMQKVRDHAGPSRKV